MSLYRPLFLQLTRSLLRTAPNHQISEARLIHRYVAPTLKELHRRRLKIGPEPLKPRSTFLEWNYDAELFAFGKRLGEEFDRNLLKQALTHKPYVVQQDLQAKRDGVETEAFASNQDLIREGDAIIREYVREKYGKKFHKDAVEALIAHLTGDEMLGHVATHLGLKDIVLTPEFPVETATLAGTFKAIVAALKQSRNLERAHLFIDDFLLSQMAGKDVFDVWSPERPLEYLENLLKERGVGGFEPRLCNQSAVNTILANYQIGLYSDKKLLGIGWGESIEVAKETAALDAIYKIHGSYQKCS